MSIHVVIHNNHNNNTSNALGGLGYVDEPYNVGHVLDNNVQYRSLGSAGLCIVKFPRDWREGQKARFTVLLDKELKKKGIERGVAAAICAESDCNLGESFEGFFNAIKLQAPSVNTIEFKDAGRQQSADYAFDVNSIDLPAEGISRVLDIEHGQTPSIDEWRDFLTKFQSAYQAALKKMHTTKTQNERSH